MSTIEFLTPEQEAAIAIYRQKWQKIALSTTPINRQEAEIAVKKAYEVIGRKTPEILFFKSPREIAQLLVHQNPEKLAQQLGAPLLQSLAPQICEQIQTQLHPNIWQKLAAEGVNNQFNLFMFIFQDSLVGENREFLAEVFWQQWQEQILNQIWEQQQVEIRKHLLKQPGGEIIAQISDFFWMNLGQPISEQLAENVWKPLSTQPLIQTWDQELRQPLLQLVGGIGVLSNLIRNILAFSIDSIDFCVSVLDCDCDRSGWEALQLLTQSCGWVIQLEKACLVCDRPRELHFDEENRLHRVGEPAILFADGYRLYAYHGTRLPEKYGVWHPHQWQSRWLLEEPNAELRRVLIQGIGYGRICQELQAIEIDSWREYTLLRINSQIDIEPIYLLKMTCPSTGHIHAVRVPPYLQSAREAIRWANWGVDPNEFAQES